MIKTSLKYFLIAVIVLFASFLIFADNAKDEFEETIPTHGIKRGNATVSVVSFLLYDKSKKEFRELKNQNTVQSGNQFIINIKNSVKAYVYILNIDATNTIYALFPSSNIRQKNPLNRDLPISLPTSNSKDIALYEFDNNTGKEIYYVFVSQKPLKTIQNIIRKIPQAGLKLRAKSTIISQLDKLYEKGQKNIRLSNSNAIAFKQFYAKKMIINHE